MEIRKGIDKMKTYYLAYGSNLNKKQMKQRCPQSRAVGSTMLHDYELVFRYYLTVEEKKGASVPLGIWAITKADEERLDRYEGYPTFYRKEYIDMEVKGKKVKGLIYIMNDVRPVAAPSGFYMDTCINGYLDFGFDVGILNEALARSIIEE